MKVIMFLLIAGVCAITMSGCCKCSTTPSTQLQPAKPADSLVLLAQTGFYDSATQSQVNFYGSELYYIHGTNRYGGNTGYLSIPFAAPLDPDTAKIFPQIVMSLAGLKINKPFNVTLHLFANLNNDTKAKAQFVGTYNNDSGGNNVKLNPYYIKQSDTTLVLPGLGSTQTGTFYLNLWGTYRNTNLWYELQKIVVSY